MPSNRLRSSSTGASRASSRVSNSANASMGLKKQHRGSAFTATNVSASNNDDNSSISSPQFILQPINNIVNENGDLDEEKSKNLAILQAMPPMLSRRAKQLSGPLNGIWACGVNPLQVYCRQ